MTYKPRQTTNRQTGVIKTKLVKAGIFEKGHKFQSGEMLEGISKLIH